MSPTRTNKMTRTPPRIIDQATFHNNQTPEFVAAVNRAADLKLLMAIQSNRLRVVPPYKLPDPARYIPRMDLIDDPSSSTYSAVFEIPGIKTNDVTLGIRNGHLFILGQRKSQHPISPNETSSHNVVSTTNSISSAEPETAQVRRLPVHELRYGTFERAIPIPTGLKESDIHATLSDGMLTVTWPRSSAAAIGTVTPSRSTSSTSPPPASVVTAGTASQ